MKSVSYALAVVLFLGWGVGCFGFHTGRQVHILFVLAMINVSAIFMNKEFWVEK
jgi:hypothetical protein